MTRTKRKADPIARALTAPYLIPLPRERGEQCACKSPGPMQPSGAWAVEDPRTGKFYMFDPPTQMQKDIWIGDDRENRIVLLRWYCFTCNTVQLP